MYIYLNLEKIWANNIKTKQNDKITIEDYLIDVHLKIYLYLNDFNKIIIINYIVVIFIYLAFM